MELASHDHDPVRVDADDSQAMVVFARDTDTAGAARHWLLQFLQGHGWPNLRCQDAELVISELVTNALRHGLGEVVVRGTLTDDELQVSVTDSGPELPEIQPIDPDRVGGVGLRIVDRLATDWGVASFPGGKTVWAILVPPASG